MKNFLRRSSHGHNESMRRELAHHAQLITWVARIHSRTFINTVTLCAKRQLIYYIIWNRFSKVPEGGGANRSTRRKIGITYLRRKSNVPVGNRTFTL